MCYLPDMLYNMANMWKIDVLLESFVIYRRHLASRNVLQHLKRSSVNFTSESPAGHQKGEARSLSSAEH